MDAGDHRGDFRILPTRLTDSLQGRADTGFRRSNNRGQESRDTHLEHRLAKSLHGRDVEREPVKIMSSIAINLQVNEACAQPLLLAVLLEFNRRNQATIGRDDNAPARRGIAAEDALGRGGGHGSAGKF